MNFLLKKVNGLIQRIGNFIYLFLFNWHTIFIFNPIKQGIISKDRWHENL